MPLKKTFSIKYVFIQSLDCKSYINKHIFNKYIRYFNQWSLHKDGNFEVVK